MWMFSIARSIDSGRLARIAQSQRAAAIVWLGIHMHQLGIHHTNTQEIEEKEKSEGKKKNKRKKKKKNQQQQNASAKRIAIQFAINYTNRHNKTTIGCPLSHSPAGAVSKLHAQCSSKWRLAHIQFVFELCVALDPFIKLFGNLFRLLAYIKRNRSSFGDDMQPK